MAEWSMAVVLKTSPIGYTKTVMFAAQLHLNMGKIWPDFARSSRSSSQP